MAPEGCISCMASGDFPTLNAVERFVVDVPDPPCSSNDASQTTPLHRLGSKRGQCKRYGVKAVQGSRSYMEDTHVAMSKFMSFKCANHGRLTRASGTCQRVQLQLYGVFDGHGGAAVAEHCADTLPKRLYDCIKGRVASRVHEQHQVPNSFPPPSPALAHADVANTVGETLHDVVPNAMETAFKDMDDSLRDNTIAAWTGSTAIVAVVGLTSIWIANCGDSRAVLCHQGTAVPLSKDHKPSCPAEAERIARVGGVIVHNYGRRVMGVLSVSRAIGDHSFQQYGLSAEPEIRTLERKTGDEFLLLASDGLWEVMSNEDAIQLARRCFLRAKSRGAGPGAAARISANVLIRVALGRGSGDNITVLVVDLTPDGEQQAADNMYPADQWNSGSLGSEDGGSGGDDVVDGVLRVSGSGAHEGTLRQRDASNEEGNRTSRGSEPGSPEVGEACGDVSPISEGESPDGPSSPVHVETTGAHRPPRAERSYSNLTQISADSCSEDEQQSGESDAEDGHAASPPNVNDPVQLGLAQQCDEEPCGTEDAPAHLPYRPVLSPFADHSWQQDTIDPESPSAPIDHSPKNQQPYMDRVFSEPDTDLSVTSPFYLHPYSPTSTPAAHSSTFDATPCTFSTCTDNTVSQDDSVKSISPFAAAVDPASGPADASGNTAWFPWNDQPSASTSPFSLPPGIDSPFELGPCPVASDEDPAVFGDLSYGPGQYSSSTTSKLSALSGEQPDPTAGPANTDGHTLEGARTACANTLCGGANAISPAEVPSGNPFKDIARKSNSFRTSPFASRQHGKHTGFHSIQLPSHCSSPFWLEQEVRSIELQHKATSLPSPTTVLTGEDAKFWEADMQSLRSARLDHLNTHTGDTPQVSLLGASKTGIALKDKTAAADPARCVDSAASLSVSRSQVIHSTIAEAPEYLDDEGREFSLGHWVKGRRPQGETPNQKPETSSETTSQHTINVQGTNIMQNELVWGKNNIPGTAIQRKDCVKDVPLDSPLSNRHSKSDTTDLQCARVRRVTLQRYASLPLGWNEARKTAGHAAGADCMNYLSLGRFGSSGLELMIVH